MSFLMTILAQVIFGACAYDTWCFERIEALLKWLDDWFSVSQKRVEQCLIWLYCIAGLISAWKIHWAGKSIDLILIVLVGRLMYTQHRRPAAARWGARYPWTLKVFRVMFQGLMLLLTLPFAIGSHSPMDIADVIRSVIYIVFFYVTSIHFDGEKGRKRKLALNELKKLFGVEWMPQPVRIPG